jgi:hypothetical protein
MNVRAPDPSANYFKWSVGSLNINDAFDTATGASKMNSTAQFDTVRYDSATTKQAAIPGGLRSLFLFPVATWETAVSDSLQVAASGKMVIIRYVHRGSAYQFQTDANGKLNILTGCKVASGVGDNIDWTTIRLTNDTFSSSASRHYEGMLDVAYADGILTIKGNLIEKKR